jgi:glyoxylase-like metal-dependent hydrolase (beta-lactamase superfamily II)
MKTLLTAVALLAFASPAFAQTTPAGPAAPQPPLPVQRLATNVNLVIGDGGNILVLNGPEGVLLVDAELPQGAPRVMAAVAAIDPSPLRFVIDTHWHVDHTGGNRYMTGQGAVVIGHDAVRTRRMTDQTLRVYGATVPAARYPQSLPILTFDNTMSLHLNGQTVRAFHMPGAHTDGDVLVHFVEADVIHMGDVYFAGMYPFIDTGSGGRVQGMIAAVDRVIAMADEDTQIVPAHGPVGNRTDLIAYRDMLVRVMTIVQAGIDAGQTLEQIQASRLAAAWTLEGEADPFIAVVHDSLTMPSS